MAAARFGTLARFLAVVAGLVCIGCPRSTTSPPELDAAVSLDAGVDSGRRGRDSGPRDGGFGWDVFVDPGCDGGIVADGAVRRYICDPLAGGCDEGLGCYVVTFPPDDLCGEEVFMSFCLEPGSGHQGDPCRAPTECASGHTCVVTGAGTQCAQVCDPGGGEPSCPRGRLCRGTDIPGFGACF